MFVQKCHSFSPQILQSLFCNNNFVMPEEAGTVEGHVESLFNQTDRHLGPIPNSKTHYRMLLFKTGVVCATFFVMGACIAIPGPTLLDLQYQLKAPIGRVSQIYLWRALGYLLGSMAGGLLFKMCDRVWLMATATLLSSVGTALVPFISNIFSLYVCFFTVGVPMGLLDTGGNILVMDIWGVDSGPYMQALHFCFGLGALAAPLLALPFISPSQVHTATGTPPQLHNATGTPPQLHNATGSHGLVPLYLTLSSLTAVVSLLYVWLKQLPQTVSDHATADPVDQPPAPPRSVRRLITGCMAVVFALYVGAEVSMGQLLLLYSTSGPPALSKHAGALLTALFWGSFSGGRALSVCVAHALPAGRMMLADYALVAVSAALLLQLPDGGGVAQLAAAVALCGLGMASVYPSGMVWLQRRMPVDELTASLLVVSGAAGEMALPVIIASFMSEGHTPAALPRALAVCVVVCVMAHGTAWWLHRRHADRAGHRYTPMTQHGEDDTPLTQHGEDDTQLTQHGEDDTQLTQHGEDDTQLIQHGEDVTAR